MSRQQKLQLLGKVPQSKEFSGYVINRQMKTAHVICCSIELCYVMLCYVMSCYVMSLIGR
jgi:hypothetical protein